MKKTITGICLFFITFSLSISTISAQNQRPNTWRWWKYIPLYNYERGGVTQIATDADNHIIATGIGSGSLAFPTYFAAGTWLVKWDSVGTLKWSTGARFWQQFGLPSKPLVCTDTQGNVYWALQVGDSVEVLNRRFRSPISNPSGFLVVKLNPNGDFQWGKTFWGIHQFQNTTEFRSMTTDQKGNILISGLAPSIIRSEDGTIVAGQTGLPTSFVLRLNTTTGNMQKALTFSGVSAVNKVVTDRNSDVVVAGSFTNSLRLVDTTVYAFDNKPRWYIARLDSAMNRLKWLTVRTGSALTMDMNISEIGQIFVSGEFESQHIHQFSADGRLLRQVSLNNNWSHTRSLLVYRDKVLITGVFNGGMQTGGLSINSTITLDNSLFLAVFDTTFRTERLHSVVSWGLTDGTALAAPQSSSGKFILGFNFDRFIGMNNTGLEASNSGYPHSIIAVDNTFITPTQEVNFEDIKVYPNPTSDILHVQTIEPLPVSVANLQGQTLLKGTSNTPLSMSGLSAGLYIVSVVQGNGQTRRFSVMVTR